MMKQLEKISSRILHFTDVNHRRYPLRVGKDLKSSRCNTTADIKNELNGKTQEYGSDEDSLYLIKAVHRKRNFRIRNILRNEGLIETMIQDRVE